MKDLSHLPSSKDIEGMPPDPDDTFVRVLVDELAQAPRKPKAADTMSRHSAAGSCLKRIALERDGVDPEPMDIAGLHVTRIGTLMHEDWQAAVQRKWPTAEIEVTSVIDDLTSGSGDTLLRAYLPDEDRVLELKTSAVTSYEYMIGMKGQAQGPKLGHKIQLGLNVRGRDAASGTLVYMARSSVSQGKAERAGIAESLRIGAQWTYSRAELDPVTDEWLAALEWVRDHPTDEVPRWVMGEMPKGARLDPTTGTWTLKDGDDIVDTGSYWSKGAGCLHYCPVAGACVERWKQGR